MKDYKNPIKATMNRAKDNLLDIADAIYQQGYEAGKADTPFTDTEEAEKRAYEQGLNDVWEVIKKITDDERDGGYPIEMLNGLFGGVVVYDIVHDYTPKEALAKIKKYEDKQKCKECKRTKDPIFYGYCVGECDYAKQTEDEIKVGDEVTTTNGSKGIVITDEPSRLGDISVWLSTCTHVQLYPVKDLSKTGRHFPQIAEVLAELRGAENDE